MHWHATNSEVEVLDCSGLRCMESMNEARNNGDMQLVLAFVRADWEDEKNWHCSVKEGI